jgi:hypothetical protein
MNHIPLLDSFTLMADFVWRPGFGARWIWWISATHLLAAWLCYNVGKKERSISTDNNGYRSPVFWFVLAAFMAALCLNKVFDLLALVTIFLRKSARLEGWYAQRRSFQAVFVLASALIGLTCLAGSIYLLRGRWRQRGLACFAAVFLVTLIVVRTASYHPVDDILYHLPGIGNRMNAGLELTGAMLVSAGAVWTSRQVTRSAR